MLSSTTFLWLSLRTTICWDSRVSQMREEEEEEEEVGEEMTGGHRTRSQEVEGAEGSWTSMMMLSPHCERADSKSTRGRKWWILSSSYVQVDFLLERDQTSCFFLC